MAAAAGNQINIALQTRPSNTVMSSTDMSATNLIQDTGPSDTGVLTQTIITNELHSLLRDITFHQYQWSQTGSLVILITASTMATINMSCLLAFLTTPDTVQVKLTSLSLLLAIVSMTCASIPVTAYAGGLWNQVSLIAVRIYRDTPLNTRFGSQTKMSTKVAQYVTICMFPCSTVFLAGSMMALVWSLNYALDKQTQVFGVASSIGLTVFIGLLTLLVLYIDLSCKFQIGLDGRSIQPCTYLTIASARIATLVSERVQDNDTAVN